MRPSGRNSACDLWRNAGHGFLPTGRSGRDRADGREDRPRCQTRSSRIGLVRSGQMGIGARQLPEGWGRNFLGGFETRRLDYEREPQRLKPRVKSATFIAALEALRHPKAESKGSLLAHWCGGGEGSPCGRWTGKSARPHIGHLHRPASSSRCLRRLLGRRGRLPGGYRRGRCASCVFCLLFVFRGACVCG
jgi:hypothetical protein